MKPRLVFLKLGGSLITIKDQPHTPRLDVIQRLATEIAEARAQDPALSILLGHGSGSFGHVDADRYHTRQGVRTPAEWVGFVEVWRQAAQLDHLVMHALEKADLPAMAFPPSAMLTARQGMVASSFLEPLRKALDAGLLPVIYGDVIFDQELGGTILSTEELFSHLVPHLEPQQLLFAGLEPGVWADFPANTTLLPEITPAGLPQVKAGLQGSTSTDVTGGMLDKVQQILRMITELPGLRAAIFSGEVPGNLHKALLGEMLGTQLHG